MAAHRACGFHTHRWADDFEASASQLAGLSPTTFVSPLASDPDDIRREAASPECAAALASLDALVGDRPATGRVDRFALSPSEAARRVRKEGIRTCRCLWAPCNINKTKK